MSKTTRVGFIGTMNRQIDFVEIERKELALDEVSTQYNPDRFAQYKSVHEGVCDLVLKMSESPHCQLLRDYEEKGDGVWKGFRKHRYYRMQKRFGKRRKSAISKAQRLVELYENIKKNGFVGYITVIDKPVTPNPYNSGYEICNGHHRVACCIALGINALPAIIQKIKNGQTTFSDMYTGVTDLECADCVSYEHCKKCEANGDFSLRRCQRTIEEQYYSKFFDKDILEIGCGTQEKGGSIKAIVEANGCRWVGIDILATNLTTNVCSVEKMPFVKESFDVIIGSQTIEHWKRPGKALRQIRQVLRPDGIVSLTAPVHLHGHKNFVSGNFDVIQKMIMKNGFKIERFETWRRKHSDLSAYRLDDYNKKYLRKAGIFKYDNVEKYIVHFILRKN